MRRSVTALLLAALTLSLSGCFYEQAVSTVRYDLGNQRCFQGVYAGHYRYFLVREFHKPTRLGQFPDGGTPFDLAAYITVERDDEGAVGRIDLPLFRRGDFGNLEAASLTCQEPNLLNYRVENGYLQKRKTTEGTLTIPPRP